MRIVIAGAMANKAGYGGEAWVRLAWARGLRAVGAKIFFVEEYDPRGRSEAGSAADLRFFANVCAAHGLAGAASVITPDGVGLAGLPVEAALDFASDADLLVNISGNLSHGPLFRAVRRRAYLDLDPGFTQFWHADGVGDLRLGAHEVHFTVGLNVGSPRCPLPTGGIEWIPVLQPFVAEEWPRRPAADGTRFTTVAAWRGAFGSITRNGRTYGTKAHEFRKVADLPGRVPFEFEIALDIHPADDADRKSLVERGWLITDPSTKAGTPEAFRDYVGASMAEFSVAQGVYVDRRTGWFSDRSVRYLASGRPVVVQDTGFGGTLPVGEGILSFRDLSDAERAVRSLVRDRGSHEGAARQIAEEFFDARKVLPAFLDRALAGGAARGVRTSDRPEGGQERSATPNLGDAVKARSRTVVVSGMVTRVPNQGGATWAALQYVLGLKQLGHTVVLLEELDAGDLTPAGATLTGSHAARAFRRLVERYGLAAEACLLLRGTRQTVGLSWADLTQRLGNESILLNLSGTLRGPDLLERIPTRVYLDLDPAFTQLWHQVEGLDVGLSGHTHHATVGLELGRPGCEIPVCGISWIPTLPPVVLDHWAPVEPLRSDAITTVANWRSYGSVTWKGVHYGQKVHAFRELLELPSMVRDQRFDVALTIHEDETEDIAALEAHRFHILDPDLSAGSPDSYRSFVRSSAAELGVAKTGYVRSRCGWFSDRSACYLAAGRPVLAQDTGFQAHLPTGEGLLAFRTAEEAADGVRAIRRDYAAHSRAAQDIAAEHLDARKVLRRLMEQVT
ncbi:MAG TPA: hypothetical protein VLA36_11505 [Longimicrobiales bacterium]|nr:hypothetical protein [Longimicrobiales bacterium]